jgi:hypothetical protein
MEVINMFMLGLINIWISIYMLSVGVWNMDIIVLDCWWKWVEVEVEVEVEVNMFMLGFDYLNFHLYNCQVNNPILPLIIDILTPTKKYVSYI